MLTASEINSVLEDSPDSVTVVYAGESAFGVFEAPGEVVLAEDGRAGVVATDPSVGIAADIFATSLRAGEAITVDGTAYTIRESLPIEDGKLTRIWLEEV